MDTDDVRERVLASAVKFLIDGGDHQAALALIPCSIDLGHRYFHGNDTVVDVIVSGPRASYDAMKDWAYGSADDSVARLIHDAVLAHLPYGFLCEDY